MNLRESLRISWRSIKGHKLRSTLTTLGIVIGIGAVIAFQVFGGGLQEDLVGDIEQEQDPIITIQTQAEGEFAPQTVGTTIYTQTDVQQLANISNVEYVAPEAVLSADEVTYRGDTIRGGIGGFGRFTVAPTRASLFEASLFNLTAGRAFEGPDEVVLNQFMLELFAESPAVGDEITLQLDGSDEPLTVVGIVDDSSTGPSQPTLYLPVDPYYTTTTETPRGTEERVYPRLLVGASSFQELDAVQREADSYMQTESDAVQLLGDTEEELTIAVQTVEETIDQFTDILDQITLFLGGIAAISLLVGSIGIANIMIVSVTERTREIGIMKAIGARRRDVIQLFLVEALVLGIIGALFGVLAGLAFGFVGVSLLDYPMVYPLDWAVIAVGVGILVGVISGLYPAWRAARVDPIEALRRE
jgi:ABC-type antimicrobial peptide transport system, permease component